MRTLSDSDRALLEAMKQREAHLKDSERATDAVLYESRRYRAMLLLLDGVLGALIVAATLGCFVGFTVDSTRWRIPTLVAVGIGGWAGTHMGQLALGTTLGRRLTGRRERASMQQRSADLYAGRRWRPFIYHGEDIGPYVPQLLFFLDENPRFGSIEEALDFIRSQEGGHAPAGEGGLAFFDAVAAEATSVAVSSVGPDGVPSSRFMRYVRTAERGVWFLTTAPEGPMVREIDAGRVAVLTVPTSSGATISSNRVRMERAGIGLGDIVDLYEDQVPGYTDGLTPEELASEVVYRLRFESASVDSWLRHEVVSFGAVAPDDPS